MPVQCGITSGCGGFPAESGKERTKQVTDMIATRPLENGASYACHASVSDVDIQWDLSHEPPVSHQTDPRRRYLARELPIPRSVRVSASPPLGLWRVADPLHTVLVLLVSAAG